MRGVCSRLLLPYRRSDVTRAGHGQTRARMIAATLRSRHPSATEESNAIADFLDRETAKIDALVARKERLIELLQEKRTALITRAVTRGLDPNVPMKDSGVEWLGEIPAHWEVKKKLSTFDHYGVGHEGGQTKPTMDDEGPFLLRAGNRAGQSRQAEQADDVRTSECHLPDREARQGEDFLRGRRAVRPDAGAVQPWSPRISLRSTRSVSTLRTYPGSGCHPLQKSTSRAALRYCVIRRLKRSRCRGGITGKHDASTDAVERSLVVLAFRPSEQERIVTYLDRRQPGSTPSSPRSAKPSTTSRSSAPP